ncbi:MAG: nucleotidyltransferase [Thermosphaera sp.]
MKYKRSKLADIFNVLYRWKINGVVIGDTSVQLYLNYSELEGDIDVFTLDFSPLSEREKLEEIAVEQGWELTSSEIGLPALVVPLEEGYVLIEFYENYMDIDIPMELLEDSVEYRIDATRVKSIRPEFYLVLKARQGTDLDKLEKYLAELKRRGFNLKLVEYAVSLYPPEEQELIYERLRSVKLEV